MEEEIPVDPFVEVSSEQAAPGEDLVDPFVEVGQEAPDPEVVAEDEDYSTIGDIARGAGAGALCPHGDCRSRCGNAC